MEGMSPSKAEAVTSPAVKNETNILEMSWVGEPRDSNKVEAAARCQSP